MLRIASAARMSERSTVPLSEHEQRLLEQIERALYEEDPKFATAYRVTDLRRHYSRRIVRYAVLFVLGLGLLLGGLVTKQVPIGVGGFAVMLVALFLGVTSWQRLVGIRAGRRPAVDPRPVRRHRGSFTARLEERWQRRWEDRGR